MTCCLIETKAETVIYKSSKIRYTLMTTNTRGVGGAATRRMNQSSISHEAVDKAVARQMRQTYFVGK